MSVVNQAVFDPPVGFPWRHSNQPNSDADNVCCVCIIIIIILLLLL